MNHFMEVIRIRIVTLTNVTDLRRLRRLQRLKNVLPRDRYWHLFPSRFANTIFILPSRRKFAYTDDLAIMHCTKDCKVLEEVLSLDTKTTLSTYFRK